MDYDIIVVGGGHAGCEAALAASRLNNKTLLVIHLMGNHGSYAQRYPKKFQKFGWGCEIFW